MMAKSLLVAFALAIAALMGWLAYATSQPDWLITVADTGRVICIALAAVLIGLCVPYALRLRRANRRQASLVIVAFMGLIVSALFTEVGRVGEVLTWRLIVNLLAIGLGVVTVGQLVLRQKVRQLRRATDPQDDE